MILASRSVAATASVVALLLLASPVRAFPGGGTAAAAPSAAADATDPSDLVGTVLETIDAGTYTYLRLQTGAKETWVAVPKTAAKVGEKVSVANPMPMDGFESRTLNRKFDRIFFGALRTPAPHHGAPAAVADTAPVAVEKAKAVDGKTVAEVFAERKALAGKSVTVRGKVAKVSKGILGRNWIHLRDGSGTPEKKDFDLLVTSSEVAETGAVVTVSGKVAVDRDFGAGYAYDVLIEEAKLTTAK